MASNLKDWGSTVPFRNTLSRIPACPSRVSLIPPTRRRSTRTRRPSRTRSPSGIATSPSPSSPPGLLLVLFLIFSAEQYFEPSVTPGFDVGGTTLTALGALDSLLAGGQGEWWRVATAPFLHASFLHILSNGAVLLIIGAVLEKLIGRAWMAATFVVSAFAGAAAALMLNPPDLPTVGASGGIVGLLTAAFVLSFHPACHRSRWWPARLRASARRPRAHPDRRHARRAQHRRRLQPPGRRGRGRGHGLRAAGPLAGGGRAAPLPGFRRQLRRRRLWRRRRRLCAGGLELPGLRQAREPADHRRGHAEEPGGRPGPLGRARARLSARPRAHLYRAAWFEGQGDFANAEQEVRTALTDPETTALGFSPAFQMRMRYDLAMLLFYQAPFRRRQGGRPAAVRGRACRARGGARVAEVGGALRALTRQALPRALRRVFDGGPPGGPARAGSPAR